MVDFSSSSGSYGFTNPQRDLLMGDDPVIDILGDVNHKMFLYVREATMLLRSRGNPPVSVSISSPGGSVEAGLDIYDVLRLYTGKKKATVYDQAASMGAVILQACDERECARHAHVLIHHISRGNVTLDMLRSKKRLANMIGSMESLQKRQYEILSSRTGKTISEIRKACAKDTFMTSEEALEFGLIDTIV